MGLSIYVEVEREVVGMIFASVEGKSLARAFGEAALAPLTKFSSFTDAQLEDLAEEWEEIAPPGEPLSRVEWFEAAPGLEAAEQILSVLKTTPDALQNAEDIEGVIEDLEGIAQNLRQATKFGVRFHLAGDF